MDIPGRENQRDVIQSLVSTEKESDEKVAPVGYGTLWRERRQDALERDGYMCQECGQTEDLTVHHITSIREFIEPEEAHRLENLVTLCAGCHTNEHT
jgi:5-methylcytosine-specific restriction endonuclease McrA